tara:strand:- start:969 stop:1400 length:432 start_codon:yes stop_codon:yes gene_type:complete
VKACFDTSVLVAALVQQHPQHALAFPRLREVHHGTVQGCLTTHGLAELYSTLTSLPLKPRLSPAHVEQIIQSSVLGRFSLIALTAKDYQAALRLTVAQDLPSGAIYDALHLVGARRAGAGALFTFNLRHFNALAPGDPLIASP